MNKSNSTTTQSIYATIDVIDKEIIGDILLVTLGRVHVGACSSHRYIVVLDIGDKKIMSKYDTIGEATAKYEDVVNHFNKLTATLDGVIDTASSRAVGLLRDVVQENK